MKPTTNISGYYRQTSGLRIARIDTTARCGNLAYAMKNSTIIVPTVQINRQYRSSSFVRKD